MTPLYEFLAGHRACIKSLDWLGGRDLRACWHDCPRGDWLLWLLIRIKCDDSTLRLLGCAMVQRTPLADGRTVWDLLTDERDRNVVEVTERYARGEASDEGMRTARAAAVEAARAAAWSAARAAAVEAARAAAWSAARDAAWYSAWYSARAAAWAADRDAAWYSARDAAWAAARDAARDAAGAAARDAARAAAEEAAWAADRAAAWAADSARAAAYAAASAAATAAQAEIVREMVPFEQVEELFNQITKETPWHRKRR
jgi:hypothetical protein